MLLGEKLKEIAEKCKEREAVLKKHQKEIKDLRKKYGSMKIGSELEPEPSQEPVQDDDEEEEADTEENARPKNKEDGFDELGDDYLEHVEEETVQHEIKIAEQKLADMNPDMSSIEE